MRRIAHGEHIVEEPDWHLRDRPIHVGHATVENSNDRCNSRGERTVPSAAKNRQLVAGSDHEVSCKNGPDDDLRCITVSGKTSF